MNTLLFVGVALVALGGLLSLIGWVCSRPNRRERANDSKSHWG